MKKKICMVTAILLALASPSSKVMADEKKVAFDFTGGLVISSGYGDLIKEVYGVDGIDGGLGWGVLGAGLKFNLNKQLSITPGADFLMNFTSVSTYFYYDGHLFNSSESSYVNLIILPKVTAHLQFSPEASPFIEAELNDNIPSTGGDVYDFKSGGLGYGASIGYQFKSGMRIQAGYQYIPVDTSIIYFGDSRPIGSKNLGGFGLKIGGSF
jgi:hypothetical protein